MFKLSFWSRNCFMTSSIITSNLFWLNWSGIPSIIESPSIEGPFWGNFWTEDFDFQKFVAWPATKSELSRLSQERSTFNLSQVIAVAQHFGWQWQPTLRNHTQSITQVIGNSSWPGPFYPCGFPDHLCFLVCWKNGAFGQVQLQCYF